MITIAVAVLVLGVFGYVMYQNHETNLRIKAAEEEKARADLERKAEEKLAAQKLLADAEERKKEQALEDARIAQAEADAKKAEDDAAHQRELHLAAARGSINIATEPSGATIAIDNLTPRTSPALFTSLTLGHKSVTITLPNYDPAKLDIEVKENETADPGVIKLVHQTGSLELASDPPGVAYSVRSTSNVFLLGTGTQSSNATTVFNESWADGTRTNQNPPNSLAWYCSSTGTSVSVSSGSLTLSTGGSSARHLVAYFPKQTLNPGDTLTLTFQFSLTGPLQSIGNNSAASLKVGLFQSNDSFTYDSDNQQSTNPVTYVGYAVGTGFSLPDETASSLINIRKRNGVSGNLITSNAGIFFQLPSQEPEKQPWQPDTTYTGTISVQVVSSTEARISANYSGGGLNDYSTTATDRATGSSPIVSSFDTLAFALPSAGGQTAARALTLSNVKVTCTTPGGGLNGTTPATLTDLPAGDYIVTFSREGFQSHSETVTVSHDAPTQLSWKFTNGNVLITSTPSGATVTTSDGRTLGVTPVTVSDVPPGDVTYQLTLDGFDPATVSGKIEGGKTNTLDTTLLSVDRLAKPSELDSRPQAIEQPQPELPSQTYDNGVVVVALTVDRSGNPKDLEVKSNTTNNSEIARRCLAAVAKWKFKPGIIDDKPVNVRITVPFTIGP
jgi:TonB family protein